MTINERIAAYLERVPPCIAGQGGDTQLFKTACILYNDWGLPESETLEWLKIYNQKCEPPWTLDRLEHKVAQAVKTPHLKLRGHLRGPSECAPALLPLRPKRSETPIMSTKVPYTATTSKSHIMRSEIPRRTPLNSSSASRGSQDLTSLPSSLLEKSKNGTDATAESKSDEQSKEWKVPDPPPGLNRIERQKFYMDDLRDAIGAEWITAPPGCPATGVLIDSEGKDSGNGVGGPNSGAGEQIRIRAERKAGQLLKEIEREGKRTSVHGEPKSSGTEYQRAKREAHISDTQSERWQQLAALSFGNETSKQGGK